MSRSLTPHECREILGPDCAMSDEELEELAVQLRVVAEVIVECYLRDQEESYACRAVRESVH